MSVGVSAMQNIIDTRPIIPDGDWGRRAGWDTIERKRKPRNPP